MHRLIYAPKRGQSQITAATQTAPPPRLVLYSKADCHLCHGLKVIIGLVSICIVYFLRRACVEAFLLVMCDFRGSA